MRVLSAALLLAAVAASTDPARCGEAVAGDWRADAPGVSHYIDPAALPAPFASPSAADMASVIPRPDGAVPHVPPGFAVTLFAAGLNMPRTMRTAPNGDIFLAETGSGTIRVLRAADGASKAALTSKFATDLSLPFGIAFWPAGPAPRFVYVGEADKVVRFPYQTGDLEARGPAEAIVPVLPTGGHWTRDVVFSPDGSRMFVAVGSASNLATELTGSPPQSLPLGAAWGDDANRADVLEFTPDGGAPRIFATGLRNCSAEAVQPGSGDLWCAVNERDDLGDDLPPDYVTRVAHGGFYGWPWFYIGAHPDPRMGGARQDLASRVTVPDVLIQPHSAPLGIVFYEGSGFPPEYRGDVFVALHGSWNRALRTGYKVVRVRLRNGRPMRGYEDFLTGFVASNRAVWGRPVGLTVAHDGSLLISEDANGTIWRVAYRRVP
jgi:glucose/arabinose dehydrogenase